MRHFLNTNGLNVRSKPFKDRTKVCPEGAMNSFLGLVCVLKPPTSNGIAKLGQHSKIEISSSNLLYLTDTVLSISNFHASAKTKSGNCFNVSSGPPRRKNFT